MHALFRALPRHLLPSREGPQRLIGCTVRAESQPSTRARIKTGPLPRLPLTALEPETLETSTLPKVFLTAFLALLVIQLFLVL